MMEAATGSVEKCWKSRKGVVKCLPHGLEAANPGGSSNNWTQNCVAAGRQQCLTEANSTVHARETAPCWASGRPSPLRKRNRQQPRSCHGTEAADSQPRQDVSPDDPGGPRPSSGPGRNQNRRAARRRETRRPGIPGCEDRGRSHRIQAAWKPEKAWKWTLPERPEGTRPFCHQREPHQTLTSRMRD